MRAKYPERTERLRKYLNELKIRNKDVAAKLKKSPGYVSQLLNFHSTISPAVAIELGKTFTNLNIEWLLDGVGEMLIINGGGSFSTYPQWTGEPPAIMVGNLYDEVLRRYQPDSLSARQDLALREACYRVLVDNPGVPWASLVIAAGVYLRFIETIPGVEIPGPRPGFGSQPKSGQ